MAHIAIVTGLLVGRLNSSFEMATRLQKEGHTITFLCQPQTTKGIEANGFSCAEVPEITFDYQDPRRPLNASWFQKLRFHFSHLQSHYSAGKEILKLEEHQKVLAAVQPDLILVDTEIHEFIFVAIKLKIPVKLITTWFSDTISFHSPSVRTSIIPGKGFTGSKIGIAWSWLKMRAKINARVVLNRLTFENYRRWMFKKFARELGFDTAGMLVNTLPPLYSFTRLPILTMTMAELEFPHKRASNISHIGPMIFQKRIHALVGDTIDNRLAEILENKKSQNHQLVYLSVGSLAEGNVAFMQKVIDAMADVNEVVLIVSIGPKMKVTTFNVKATNVHLFNWVSQPNVLEVADCAIVSCGINTINECIHFKVPMLLYALGYTDQNGNAAKMEYHGLGKRGNMITDTTEQIRKNVLQMLNDQSSSDTLVKVHSTYTKYKDKDLTPILFEGIKI